jgi:hypothetical protein
MSSGTKQIPETQAFGRIPAREPVTKRMQLSVIGAKESLNKSVFHSVVG